MAEKLTDGELTGALEELSGWVRAEGRHAIKKTYKFKDFTQAFAFMTKVAEKAEHMDHHPEWFNVYATIDVTLATHDAGGVTRLDIDLAKFMDDTAGLD